MSTDVTFLMTTYNGGEFLAPAIESVRAQTVDDFRMLIIDDASTDDSAEIAKSFGDSRIEVVVLSENVGQTAALNMGLDRIHTPWVARLDQDDIAAPRRLEAQLEYISRHPHAVLVGSLADFIDPSGNVVGQHRPTVEPEDVVLELFVRGCPIVHSGVTYRTDVAREVGGYPSSYDYAQDLAMWIAMSAHGEIGNVGEVLTFIRSHPGQTSRAPEISARQLGEMLEITENIPEHVTLGRRERRLWQARRARLMFERAIVAARARDARLAVRSALHGISRIARTPFSLGGIIRVGAATARKRIRHRLT